MVDLDDAHLDAAGLGVELVEGADPKADGSPQLLIRREFLHGEGSPIQHEGFSLAKVGGSGARAELPSKRGASEARVGVRVWKAPLAPAMDRRRGVEMGGR